MTEIHGTHTKADRHTATQHTQNKQIPPFVKKKKKKKKKERKTPPAISSKTKSKQIHTEIRIKDWEALFPQTTSDEKKTEANRTIDTQHISVLCRHEQAHTHVNVHHCT